jgi:tripeptide aminopeptidase
MLIPNKITINEERLVQIFLDLVKISSRPCDEKEMAAYLRSFLEKLSYKVIEDDAGTKVGGNSGNLICYIPATAEGYEPVAIMTHMDTVVPCDGVKPVVKDGKIFVESQTVLGGDDKAAIAEVLELVQSLAEQEYPHGEIELVFTISEETYMYGSRNFDVKRLKSRYALVLDEQGAPGTVVNAAPYLYTMDITCKGKAAHAGMCPEVGISAIQIASKAVNEIKLGRLDEETTANIGMISGGNARNVVPETVTLIAESRSLNHEKVLKQIDSMKEAFLESAEAFGGEVRFDIQQSFPGFKLDSFHPLVQLTCQAAINTGLKAEIRHSGGGTDANILNQQGIASVVLSVGYRDMHSRQEHVYVKDLVDSVSWLYAILQAMTGKHGERKS